MKTKHFLVGIVVFILLGIAKNPIDPNSAFGNSNWTKMIEKEINNMANATANYNNDLESANCTNYKICIVLSGCVRRIQDYGLS